MLVLTNRLARIIDRSRYLEEQLESPESISTERSEQHRDELSILFRRAKKINRAILLSTSCALLICVVVAGLFIADALNLKLASIIAGMFVLAMVALTGSFIYLLREIWLATEFMNAQQSARLFNRRR